MQATDICPEYNLVFTKGAVKKVFRIAGIKPENLDMCFVDYIREEMFNLNPDVEVIISISNYPTRVDVTNDKFNRAMARASNAYETYREAYDSQSGLARMTGKTYRLPGGGRLRLSKEKLDDLRQIFLSYVYLYQYISSGGTATLTEVFVEIVGPTPKLVKRAAGDLYGIVGPFNMGIEEVRGTLRTYMEQFGLAVPMLPKLHKKFLPQLLFTDENMAAFSSYKSRGLVGGSGLLMGMDFRSRLPFMVNLFDNPSAQVFLLMGRTGSGKTYAAWQMAISALAIGCHVSAIDIKGREWDRLAMLTPHKIITFDDRNPSFVNTLRLDDFTATRLNAMELFNTAVRGTINLLMLMVNIDVREGSTSDLEMILREAVLKLYAMHRVDPSNPTSFKNSANLKYADILPLLDSLSSTTSYTDSQRKMVSLARTRCSNFIGNTGIFASSFTREVTLGDVIDTPLIIYSFNKNQNGNSADALDAIRCYMMQFLDSKKKAILREENRFLFCFYEELQRSESMGNLLELVCHDVTGSRSNNTVVVLLMNSLKVLRGDKARDIRSNITSICCSTVETNDIETIREEFGREWLAGQLQLFKDRPSIYRNCFAADLDTGSQELKTVYKVQFPDDLAKAFRTRTVIED